MTKNINVVANRKKYEETKIVCIILFLIINNFKYLQAFTKKAIKRQHKRYDKIIMTSTGFSIACRYRSASHCV